VARRAADDAQVERNRQVAAEWATRSMDAETQALLAEADEWLRENA